MSSRAANLVSPATRTLAAVLIGEASSTALQDRIGSAGMALLAKGALAAGVANEFLQAAERSGLDVPPDAENKLQLQVTETAAANLGLMRTFASTAAKFNERMIPFLLLKGAALHLSTYKRMDVRPMVDVDILVRPGDTGRVDRLLRDNACLPGRCQVRTDFYPRYYYELEYQIPGPPPCRLDVHAHPFRPLRYVQTVPVEGMWDEAQAGQLHGVTVQYPSNENMLIHLAAHCAIHGNHRFLWLYDIVRFVHAWSDELDSALAARRAADWGITLAAYRAFRAASELFEDQALAEICRNFEHPRPWRDRLVLWQAPRDHRHPVAHVTANLLTTPGLVYRLGYLWSVLVPQDAHMREAYLWRHRGWLICAHIWRFCRAGLRPLIGLFRSRDPAVEVETAAGNG